MLVLSDFADSQKKKSTPPKKKPKTKQKTKKQKIYSKSLLILTDGSFQYKWPKIASYEN